MNKLTIKLIIWHIVVLILALLMWGSGSGASFNNTTGIDIEMLSLGAFLLLTSIIVIGYALFRFKRWAWPSVVSLIVGGLFMAQFGFSWLNLTGVLMFTALNYWAYSRVGQELGQRFRVNISAILRQGLMPVILGIFIMISFAAYQSPLAENLEKSERLPSVSQNFIRSIVEQTVGRQVQAGNEAEKKNIITQITNETFREINTFLKPYFQYAPPLLAFGLFLILWGLSWIFVWLSVLLGMLIFWVLKKINVVRIVEKDVKAETLEI